MGIKGTPKQRAESRKDSILLNCQSCPSGQSSVLHGHLVQKTWPGARFLQVPILDRAISWSLKKCLVVLRKAKPRVTCRAAGGRGVHHVHCTPGCSFPASLDVRGRSCLQCRSTEVDSFQSFLLSSKSERRSLLLRQLVGETGLTGHTYMNIQFHVMRKKCQIQTIL